jgi:hypothetical protein
MFRAPDAFVSTACGSGRVINIEYPPATAGGTDSIPLNRACYFVNDIEV